MTNREAIENTKVWVIKNGDYSVEEVYQKDIGLFTQFFETKEEAEKIAEEYKQAEINEKKEIEELKGRMTNAEAIKTIKSIVETLDDYAFYTAEDKVAFDLAIKALEREEGWISAKDRLPKERDWYLGIFKENDTGWINPIPFVCDYVGHKTPYTTSGFWILHGLTDIDNGEQYYKDLVCVAWQPLPKPYEEKEK